MATTRRYRALRGVTWMSSAEQIRRVQGGERIPHEQRSWGRAEEGDELPSGVPAAAIASMLSQGSIVLIEDGAGDA